MKIYIPRHTYSDEPLHTHSLLLLQKRLLAIGVNHSFASPFYDSLIQRGRNRCAANFLASDATHLLSLDADIVFSPWDVERLIAAELDFVGAPYPMKEPTGKDFVGTLVAPINLTAEGFAEARDIGAGFTLISRNVFNRLSEVAPKAVWDWPGETTEREYSVFYDSGLDGRQYLSEDWWIARAWRAAGGKCWLDTQARLGHVGKKMYQNVSTVAAALERANAPQPEAADAFWDKALKGKAGG